MENDNADNARKKPERIIKCELCSQLFSLEEVQKGYPASVLANFVFEPYICVPCYQEIEF